ncbi:MAG: hypothetical protein P1Q69_10890 [Candidatus Thorarchaeota archaeon]|nr:hypothetical protein [Candidatus Thorarchaeota archaeon]
MEAIRIQKYSLAFGLMVLGIVQVLNMLSFFLVDFDSGIEDLAILWILSTTFLIIAATFDQSGQKYEDVEGKGVSYEERSQVEEGFSGYE